MTEKRNSAGIIGTGWYVPEKVITNEDLEQMVDTSDEWIVERTGIHERRVARKEQPTSDLAERAARMALENAGVKAEELDLIIVATMTPDRTIPSTACILQDRLGATKALPTQQQRPASSSRRASTATSSWSARRRSRRSWTGRTATPASCSVMVPVPPSSARSKTATAS
mgnify:CR=1 FL=1